MIVLQQDVISSAGNRRTHVEMSITYLLKCYMMPIFSAKQVNHGYHYDAVQVTTASVSGTISMPSVHQESLWQRDVFWSIGVQDPDRCSYLLYLYPREELLKFTNQGDQDSTLGGSSRLFCFREGF